MAAPRVSAIIASASPSRSGSMRKAKSRVTSIAVPPMPNASDRPKSGSRETPANTSTPPRDEFLHQESGIGRSRIEPADALAQLRERARELVFVREADGDEAELGLVRDVVRHRLEHDRVAELVRGFSRFFDGRDPMLARDRQAVLGQAAAWHRIR